LQIKIILSKSKYCTGATTTSDEAADSNRVCRLFLLFQDGTVRHVQ